MIVLCNSKIWALCVSPHLHTHTYTWLVENNAVMDLKQRHMAGDPEKPVFNDRHCGVKLLS